MNTVLPSFQFLSQLCLTFLILINPVQGISRTVGPADDLRFQNASSRCSGSDPKSFEFGTCSLLITCVYENLPEALKASLGSGTSIAALLPTILALIGEFHSSLDLPLPIVPHLHRWFLGVCKIEECSTLPVLTPFQGSPPLELVQLALVSPHRALATCCFSIGLPSGLFRQLRPLHTQLSNSNPREPRVREWTIPVPSLGAKRWLDMIAKLVVDVLILTLASIMLWRNWVVTSFTMVPWRCEYSWLLFAW